MDEAPAGRGGGRGLPGPGRRRRARLAPRRRGLVLGARAGAAGDQGRCARRRRRARIDLAGAGHDPRGGRRRARGPRQPRDRSSSTSRRRRAASSRRRRSPTPSIHGRSRPAWRDARAWMFAPVAAEVRDEWADVPRPDALVALGWQGLLRVLRDGAPVHHLPPGPSPVVRRANLVGVGSDDVDDATTPAHLAAFMHPGATLLFTDGVHGGTAYRVGERPDDLDAAPLAQHPDPEVRGPGGGGRHVPGRRLRGLGGPGHHARAGTARTRTCASGRPADR